MYILYVDSYDWEHIYSINYNKGTVTVYTVDNKHGDYEAVLWEYDKI